MKHIKLSAVMIVIAAIFIFAPHSESSIPLHTDSNRNPSSLPEFIRPQKGRRNGACVSVLTFTAPHDSFIVLGNSDYI
ncbi:MAG: hypothetical protein IJQ58_00300 [Synergistaceae bacterium]|nr:hypothetical protein [Synergistaceae bacterium]